MAVRQGCLVCKLNLVYRCTGRLAALRVSYARGPFPDARPTVAQGAVSALLGNPDVDVRCLPSLFRSCLVQAVIKHHGYKTYIRLPREVLRCLAALPWHGLVIPLRVAGVLHERPVGVCCALMAVQRVFISALSQLRARFPASADCAAVPLPGLPGFTTRLVSPHSCRVGWSRRR